MKITYSEKLREWKQGYELAQRASSKLPEVLGEDLNKVSGEWDKLENDQGDVLVTLRLKDSKFESIGQFDLTDLQSPAGTAFRLYRTWGDLLHAHTAQRIEAMKANWEE